VKGFEGISSLAFCKKMKCPQDFRMNCYMRLDRAVPLYAFRPLMEINVISIKNALPILMYHSISANLGSAGKQPRHRC
jgi:hypothetical protein